MDFKFKRVMIRDKKPVKVQIWDTAGQERFRTITQNYYRGAHGIVLVCSVDDKRSKDNIQRWLQDVRKIIRGDNFNAILVMNKCDLAEDEVQQKSYRFHSVYFEIYVSSSTQSTHFDWLIQETLEQETKELANELGLDYVLTSAKRNTGVNEAFTRVIEMVYDRLYETNRVNQSKHAWNHDVVQIGDHDGKSKKSGCSPCNWMTCELWSTHDCGECAR